MAIQRISRPAFRVFLLPIVLSSLSATLTAAFPQERAPKLQSAPLPTGMEVTPTAAPGAQFVALDPGLASYPDFRAANAVATLISPDGRTLLVLTSGYNRLNDQSGKRDRAASDEYVFVYDISQRTPRMAQVLRVPNTYFGVAWRPDSRAFYVSGGMDDSIHVFERDAGAWKETSPTISLGHTKGLGINIKPMVAGIAVNSSGTKLLAANFENDSVSLVDLGTRQKTAELDLRPGKNDSARHGVPGGEFPFRVVWKDDQTAFVSSERDRELVELSLREGLKIARRIALPGQPAGIILNRAATRLFIALHSNDSNPNSLAFSPDVRLLFVTNGGANDVAVIALGSGVAPAQKASAKEDHERSSSSRLLGLIPTGWYPTSVSVSRDGQTLYISNSISPAGPSPVNCRNSTSLKLRSDQACSAANQYVLQRRQAGLLTLPLPAPAELGALTRQVARNNHWIESPDHRANREKMALLRSRVHHVIFILKENRTYDQVLGDLEKGNGDPRLTLFPEGLTPNHHRLARQFVTLDNFYASGGVSGEGWNWSTAARATEPVQENVSINYADRGLDYDFEGTNRGINVGVGSLAERRAEDPRVPDDPDLLPGTADISEPESAGEQGGASYLWDAARRAGISLRNYGFFLNLTNPQLPAPGSPDEAEVQMPWKTKTVVAHPSKTSLRDVTDPYFHGFDQRQSDFFLFQEWAREFDEFEHSGDLPALTLLRLPHDHFGSFAQGLCGINTVETEIADNDYAVGLVAEKVSRSRYKDDTIIFITEDDAQDGPDHVDAQRTIAFVAGAYVRRGSVVATRYTTVHFLRTMEELLGIEPLSLFDAAVEPMADVFETSPSDWAFAARVPEVLRTTRLPLPPRAAGEAPKSAASAYTAPRHDAAYWEEKMRGLDFHVEDKLDTPLFNRALWEGLKGSDVPYPEERSGRDLRRNRAALLAKFAPRPAN